DFGASSGRVVRVLAAGHPDARWSGCDPNAPAIAWARANLPGIDFFVRPQDPPLDRPDGAFDLVFAISLWSHYDRGAAGRWRGTAFLTPEWLLSQIGARWHVAHFMPGCVEGNQDVYVLRRVGG